MITLCEQRQEEQEVKKKSLNLYRESIGSQDFASTGKHFQKQLKITVQAS